MNKNYILTVDNLSPKILHIAQSEAYLRGQTLHVIDRINSYAILSYACESYSDVIDVISTLETSKSVEIISVENCEDALINIHGITREKNYRKQKFSMQA
jgi:hypothetical protein